MPLDLDAEYNNRAMVPDHPAIMAAWVRDAAAYRAGRPDAQLDQAYGTGERHRYDLFPAASPRAGAPILLFIHGGYWQALDKTSFSHMAAGANAHGLDVAVMSYDLCPQVKLAKIVDEVIACTRTCGRHGPPGAALRPLGGRASHRLRGGANWPASARRRRSSRRPCQSRASSTSPRWATFVNKAMGMEPGDGSRLSPSSGRRGRG